MQRYHLRQQVNYIMIIKKDFNLIHLKTKDYDNRVNV